MKLKVGDLIKMLDCEYARQRKEVGRLARVVATDTSGVSCSLIGGGSSSFWLYNHEYTTTRRTVKFCK